MSATIKVEVHQLPHGADLLLPIYQTDGAAGLDLLAAVPRSAPLLLLPILYINLLGGRRGRNPLDALDPAGLDVAEDASTLADALVFDEPGMAGEAHWNEEAKALLEAFRFPFRN